MLQAKGVRAIDQQDIDAGVYSIYDVVMPTPGYEVQYPAYTEDKYKELLAEDGLKMGDLQNQKQRDFSLRGNYRKMLLKPKHMSWKLKRYVDKTLPLQETDVSLLTTDVPRNNWHSQAEVVERDATALCLTFELPSAAYATMCIRELLKDSTEVAHHSALNEKLGGSSSTQ